MLLGTAAIQHDHEVVDRVHAAGLQVMGQARLGRYVVGPSCNSRHIGAAIIQESLPLPPAVAPSTAVLDNLNAGLPSNRPSGRPFRFGDLISYQQDGKLAQQRSRAESGSRQVLSVGSSCRRHGHDFSSPMTLAGFQTGRPNLILTPSGSPWQTGPFVIVERRGRRRCHENCIWPLAIGGGVNGKFPMSSPQRSLRYTNMPCF